MSKVKAQGTNALSTIAAAHVSEDTTYNSDVSTIFVITFREIPMPDAAADGEQADHYEVIVHEDPADNGSTIVQVERAVQDVSLEDPPATLGEDEVPTEQWFVDSIRRQGQHGGYIYIYGRIQVPHM